MGKPRDTLSVGAWAPNAPLPNPAATILIFGAGGAVVVGAASAVQPLAGLAAVLAVAVALAIYRRPSLACVALVAITPAVSGLKRGLPVPGLRLSELLIVGIGALVLLRGRRTATTRWGSLDYALLAYWLGTLVLGVFDLLSRNAPFTGDAVGTLLGPLQFLVLYRAIVVAVDTEASRRSALRWMLVISAGVAITANLQLLDIGPSRDILAQVTGADLYGPYSLLTIPPRATGPFPFWHALGGYMYIVLLVGVALLFEPAQRVMSRRALIAVLVIDAIGLAETATIAPLLGGLMGAAMLGIWYGRGRRVLLVVGAVSLLTIGASAAFFSDRYDSQFGAGPGSQSSHTLVPQTLTYRWHIWETQNIPALAGHWITGYGPVLPPNLAFPFTESVYISLLFRGGLPLLAIFLYMMYRIFTTSKDRARHHVEPEPRAVARVLAFVVVSLMFIHLIEAYLVDAGPPHALFALLGLAVPLTATKAHSMRPC